MAVLQKVFLHPDGNLDKLHKHCDANFSRGKTPLLQSFQIVT